MILSFITLCILGYFSLLALGRDVATGSKQFDKEIIGYWSVLYGLAALFISLLSFYSLGLFLAKSVSNLLIIAFALPHGYPKLRKLMETKISNPIFFEEVEEMIEKIRSRQKFLGIVGMIMVFILFWFMGLAHMTAK